ncbi:MAG: sulfite exporter TauE/SafE family protein [Pseudomonadota bacterium]
MGAEANFADIVSLVAVLLATGAFAGFVGGLFGIGGGFVVVPALLLVFSLFNVDNTVLTHVAIGTSLATIIVTSLRSVQAHHKRGAVDLQILKDWAPWLIIGVAGGLFLARFMDGRSMKWIFSIGVFLMGLHFLFPILQNRKPIADTMPGGFVRGGLASFLGGFSALLGIGGGTIAVLTMTAYGRTIHTAVATAAGFGFIIALPGAIGFALLGFNQPDLPFGSIGYINLVAFAAITTMSFITAPLGARAAHSLDAMKLKGLWRLSGDHFGDCPLGRDCWRIGFKLEGI